MYDVEIIIGSRNDQSSVEKSGMLEILTKIGISYRLSIISAHRNPKILTKHCQNTLAQANVYIGISGACQPPYLEQSLLTQTD